MKNEAQRLVIGADHGGYALKESLKKSFLTEDLTPKLVLGDDYPLIAKQVARQVVRTQGKGVLVCTSGIGICIAANKIKGARAALCRSVSDARRARADNDANVCCLGGADTTAILARRIVNEFLHTEFLGRTKSGARHARRVGQIE